MNLPRLSLVGIVLLALGASGAAHAQTQPGAGVLRLPSKSAATKPEPPHPPPKASPVAPVQRVAPFASPVVHPPPSALGQSRPGQTAHARPAPRPRHTPVVQAPRRPQARKLRLTPAAKAPVAAAAAVAATVAVASAAKKPAETREPAPPAAEPKAAERPGIDPTKGTATGMVLPRWAALRSDDVNMRTGPGMRYPVEWQYHRRDLPVKIEREFEVWRLVEDQDGVKGWVHQATLTARRGFVLTGPEQPLRAEPRDTAAPVALLKPRVVGRILSCGANAAWCRVRAGGYEGWLRRTMIWGVFPGEAVGN